MRISRNAWLAISSSTLALALLGASSDASAQASKPGYRWEVNRRANMKFALPTAWATTTEGDLVTTTPATPTKPSKAGLGLEFVAVTNGAAEASKAEETLVKAIHKRVPDAHANGPAKPVAQNGLSGVVVRGEGTRGGRAIEWFSVVLGDGRGHGMLAIGFAAKGQLAAHQGEVVEIFNSIQPAY